MAKQKLSAEQRLALLTWLSADYSSKLIRAWFAKKKWPELTDSTLSYYRTKCAPEIEALRKERRDGALKDGLAVREERVARLVEHADELDLIKWQADDKGRYPNEKAWRETVELIHQMTDGSKITVGGSVKLSADDVLAGLPAEFRDAVRAALAEALSQE